MPVNSERLEYSVYSKDWSIIRSVVNGSRDVKAMGEALLPRLGNSSDDDYSIYRDRAQFFNGSSRTLSAYEGMIFRKPPVVEVPEELDPFIENPTRDNKHFNMLLSEIISEILEVNRVGVMIDFPSLDDANITIKESEDRNIQPTWCLYRAESIINWRTQIINNEEVLSLVVLREESSLLGEDKFSVEKTVEYRVLCFNENGEYIQELYKQNSNIPYRIIEPIMNGERMKFIPFYILDESGINYIDINTSPIYDLIQVNIGHYRNSADYEDELHKTAIKSIVGYGVAKNTLFESGGFNTFTDVDTRIEILEASQSSGLREEMTKKEQRMAVLGSQGIAQKGRFVESAETAGIQKEGEDSILAKIANHTSRSCQIILRATGLWMPTPIDEDAEIKVQINTDFGANNLPPDAQISLMQQVQSGLLDWETYIYNFQKYGIIQDGKTAEEIRDNIKNNPKPENEFDDIPMTDVNIADDQ